MSAPPGFFARKKHLCTRMRILLHMGVYKSEKDIEVWNRRAALNREKMDFMRHTVRVHVEGAKPKLDKKKKERRLTRYIPT